MRALAVVLVVAFHAGLAVPGGFTGVDIFFVISGFVITRSLLGELARVGSISLRRFYERRVKRLLPALGVMLVFVASVGTLAGPAATQRSSSITGVFASVFTANLYLGSLSPGYFDTSMSLNPLLHTWTLAVEEQFYLVFPIVLLASATVARSWMRGQQLRVAASVIAAVSAASFIYSESSTSRFAFYSASTRAWEFGAGALILIAAPRLARLPGEAARLLALLGLGAIFAAALAGHSSWPPAQTALLPVAGACALLAAGTATRSGISGVLGSKLPRWLGDRSYGWYLWHWPLIVFALSLWPGSSAAAPLAACAALLPAWISYRFVETPIRLDHRRQGRSVVALALTCTCLPILAFLGSGAIRGVLGSSSSMVSWRSSRLLHADVSKGCDSYVPLSLRSRGSCTWEVARSRGQIVLVGDSNAGHLTEPVVSAGNHAGFDVTALTYSSCPYVGIPTQPSCERFVDQNLATLRHTHPRLVILASRTDVYLRNATPPERREWQRRLASIVTELNAAGVPVLIVHPVPLLAIAADRCAVVSILTNACGSTVRRVDAERALSRADVIEQAAANSAPLTSTLDLDNQLCGRSTCSTMRNGIVMYRDDEHLSVEGAATLTGRFEQAIVARIGGADRVAAG
jgi:peptidoglycan/LPS O-acetylase OafA/YrhL